MDFIDYVIAESHERFVEFTTKNGYARYELYLPDGAGRALWFYSPASFKAENKKFCWAELKDGILTRKSEWVNENDISFSNKQGLYLVDDQLLAKPYGMRLFKERGLRVLSNLSEYDFYVVPKGLNKFVKN